MTEGTPAIDVLADGGSGETSVTRRESSALLRASSRAGVWGFVGGFGVMIAGILGAPISLETAMVLMGAGVAVSGLGTLTASWVAYRRVVERGGLVKAAALVGMPLGVSLVLLGLTSAFRWPALVSIVNAVTPAAAILGTVLLVLLVAGFVLQWTREAPVTRPDMTD